LCAARERKGFALFRGVLRASGASLSLPKFWIRTKCGSTDISSPDASRLGSEKGTREHSFVFW
jgi:hypothetical protein